MPKGGLEMMSNPDIKMQPGRQLISPLSADIHETLKNSAQIATVLSAALTTICISIIVRMSSNTSPAYAKLLLIVTLIPITTDFIFTFLFDPVPLLPLPCVLRWNPIIFTPGNVTIYYALWVTVICWNAVAYGACFIHRHQAVVPPGYPGRFSIKTRLIFLSTMMIVFTICGPILLIARYPGEYSTLKNRTSGFTDSQLKRVDCYEIHLLFIFIGYCYSMFAICFCFLATLTTHIFMLLRDTEKIPMSDKTRSYHRVMTGSLVVQTIVPIIFLFLPLCSCFVIFITGWNVSSSSPVFAKHLPIDLVLYPLSLISLHSPMHSIVLIGFTPLYRNDFLYLVSCGKLAKNRQKRSSLRTSTSRIQ